MKAINFLLLFLVIANACTIKENREKCPQQIEVQLYPYGNMTSYTTIYDNSNIISSEHKTQNKTGYIFTLPPKTLQMRNIIYSKSWNYDKNNNLITIDNNHDCDSLYTLNTVLNVKKDKNVKIKLNKKWINLIISYNNNIDNIKYVIKSNWNGIELENMSPIKGYYSNSKIGTNRIKFSIPPQGDNSLVLILYKNNVEYNKIEIGKIMQQHNYNFANDSLDDFDLEITDTKVQGEIIINDWYLN